MRLIDKQYALASAVSGIVRTDENGENWIRTRDVRESIMNNVPTIEAEPIKHGKWIKVDKHTVKCSECGNYLDMRGVNAGRADANFCPNCGAKIDQEV